jgi:hypothetical protein
MKGLNVEPAEQDLEGFIASHENLLDLSAIIIRDWREAVEEDNNYIIQTQRSSAAACKVSNPRRHVMIQEWG